MSKYACVYCLEDYDEEEVKRVLGKDFLRHDCCSAQCYTKLSMLPEQERNIMVTNKLKRLLVKEKDKRIEKLEKNQDYLRGKLEARKRDMFSDGNKLRNILDALKKSPREVIEENHTLKEKIEELEKKIKNIAFIIKRKHGNLQSSDYEIMDIVIGEKGKWTP